MQERTCGSTLLESTLQRAGGRPASVCALKRELQLRAHSCTRRGYSSICRSPDHGSGQAVGGRLWCVWRPMPPPSGGGIAVSGLGHRVLRYSDADLRGSNRHLTCRTGLTRIDYRWLAGCNLLFWGVALRTAVPRNTTDPNQRYSRRRHRVFKQLSASPVLPSLAE